MNRHLQFLILIFSIINFSQAEDRISGKNWMSAVKDGAYLNTLAIPGTHDSGAINRNTNFLAKKLAVTQNWTITEQLENGIRFLDMRLGSKSKNSEFKIRHGLAEFGLFEKALIEVKDFLDRNPTETIIMSIKHESSEFLIENFNKRIVENKNFRNYFYKKELNIIGYNNITSFLDTGILMKNVRKKIILLDRAGSDEKGYIKHSFPWKIEDNAYTNESHGTNIYTQDIYKLSIKVPCWSGVCNDYDKKVRQVINQIDKAKKHYFDYRWYVSFASAQFNGTAIEKNAKIVNSKLLSYFNKSSSQVVGVIIPMDFPDKSPGTIEAIYSNSLIQSSYTKDVVVNTGSRKPTSEYACVYYRDKNKEGEYLKVKSGVKVPNLSNYGFNDVISSYDTFEKDPGSMLYWDANYKGEQRKATRNNWIGNHWNDEASSLVCY